MTQQATLAATAHVLVSNGRGILAIDESTKTCNGRFEKLGIPPTEEMRRAYRELLLTAPVEAWVSGAILYEETLRQHAGDGRPFVDVMRARGVMPGIKVDTGTAALAGTHGELITQGLDGLAARIDAFRSEGATFTKWRAVFSITASTPSVRAIRANAEALARYAKIAQEGGLVPIVEPELLADGDHDIARCREATLAVLHEVFSALHAYGVQLDGMILKPSMVAPGTHGPKADVATVARETVDVLAETVPVKVAGIAFLSGGQDNVLATRHLHAMNAIDARLRPWPLTFSYGRALQQPAIDHWRGDRARVAGAQALLAQRARANSLAASGAYSEADERVAVSA